MISRLSGKTYADFLRDEVFLPLGMNRSSDGIGPGLESYIAARYRGGTERLPFYDFDHAGGSAVYASAHDLVRFGLFHLKSHIPDQKAILPDAALDEMHRPTVVTGGKDGYGVGWGIRDASSERRRIGHNGGMAGVSTMLELVPSEQLAVAVLGNAVSNLPQRVLEKVYTVLLPGYVTAPPAGPDLPKDEARFEPPPELRGTWRGMVLTYEAELPLVLAFHTDGDVHAHLGSQLKTLLNDVRLKDGWLTGRMQGDVGTADANRRPYILHADLKLRGEVLNGALIAITPPETRFGNALSYWTELRRSEASA